MRVWTCLCLVSCLACSQGEKAEKAPETPANSPSVPARESAEKRAPDPLKPVRTDDLKALLARVAYKPDPYETQPGCISEPKSLLRTDLTLWATLSLARGQERKVVTSTLDYTVTGPLGGAQAGTAAEQGIPRLELMHADGRVEVFPFRGEYQDPSTKVMLRSEDAVPNDPTWVKVWLGHAPLSSDITAHRIVLDDQVLREVKRPPSPPRLSTIECDDTEATGLKLAWKSESADASSPLLVDVMRHDGRSFVELVPSTAARDVTGFTLKPAEATPDRDLVLQVSITDTFHLVSRAVLIPKRAL